MRIVLAFPPHSFEDRYGKSLAKVGGVLPPLGILYLAAYLKKDGHDVSVVDGSVESYQTLISVIKEKKPKLVGISALTFLWKKTVRIVEVVKKEFPETFVVVGGPHPTFSPNQCLIDSPSLDAVVIGEGEMTLFELCNALSSGKPLDNIAGLAFRTKDAKITVNKPRELIKNLDVLPFPAREFVDIFKYRPALEQYKRTPITNLMSSRGCSFRCIFCMHATGNAIRYRSPQNIINEIEFLVDEYGIKEIAFWDDTMTVDKKRVLEICGLLKQKNLGIIWSAQARVDTINIEMLKEMRSAGCWKIFFGVESFIQKNLDALKKDTRTEQAFDAIKWTKKAGIEAEASFIFGIPGETYEEAREDMQKILKFDPDYIKCLPLTPMPGSELYENVKRFGRMLTEDFDKFTEHEIVFTPYTMTEEQMRQIIPHTYKRFYLRPSYMLKRLGKIRSFEDLQKSIRGIKAVVGL